jgi:hypothetical protein
VTRDGIAPLDLLRLGRTELDRYNVQRRSTASHDVQFAIVAAAEGAKAAVAINKALQERTGLTVE